MRFIVCLHIHFSGLSQARGSLSLETGSLFVLLRIWDAAEKGSLPLLSTSWSIAKCSACYPDPPSPAQESGADGWTSAHPRWCSTWMLNSWSSRAQPAWESISPLIHPSLTPHLATDVVSLWHKEFPSLREAGIDKDPSLHWITAMCRCQAEFSPPQIKKRGWRLWKENQLCLKGVFRACVRFSWDSQSSAFWHVPTTLLMKGDRLDFQPLQFAPSPCTRQFYSSRKFII